MKSSNPKNLYKPSAGGNKNLVRALFAIVVCLFIFIFLGRQATSQDNLFDKLESSEELLSKHASKELELTDTVSNLESKVKILEDRLKESHDERDAALKSAAAARNIRGASGNKKEDGGGEDVEAMKKSVDLVSTQIEHLKKQMQKKAKIDAIKNFGPGPHRVKFELDFNPEEVPEGDATSFIIEMAPLKLMPYTVNFFLSQVSLGLFNGCSFHRNAHHVVQGGPVANHLSHGTNLYKGFKSAGLESVSFQEYSPDFPHVKYTLGYAGRPGGPDFYVSTLDNTRNHGPGGQASYAVKSEADPCFAKVVDGFAAVDRMHKLSVESGDYMRMKHYVAIKSATIMTEKN